MPNFDYKAKDRAGQTVTGTVAARDEHEAAAMIREQGCLPMNIRAVRAGKSYEGPDGTDASGDRHVLLALWTGVSIRTLAIFYRQLATLLASGMSVSEALGSVGRRATGRLGRIIAEMQDNARRGQPLSDVMGRHPEVFNAMQVSLVRAGEAGGLLQGMIERTAEYLEYELSIRRMILKMTLYPVIIFVFIILAKTFVPYLPLLVKEGFDPFARAAWPGFRLWLFGIIGTILLLKVLFQFRTTKLIWDFAKTKPPIIGTAARKIAMSRFCRALAVLYAAGMPIGEALSVASDACGNRAVGNGIRYAVPAVQSGQRVTESLEKTGMMLPLTLDMLSTGEKTGNMDASLQKAADYMDQEVDSTIHKLGIALFVGMILVAGVMVLLLLVNSFTGYFSAVEKVAQ